MSENPFDRIDAMGSVRKTEPFMREVEAEMCRTMPWWAATRLN